MRQLIIQIPGHTDISSDLIAKTVLEIATEIGIEQNVILVNQWGDDDNRVVYTVESFTNIDNVLHKAIAIVDTVAGANGVETMANVLHKMHYGTDEEKTVLKNAITVLMEYSKPARLMQPPFRMKGYVFNSLKTLHDKHLI